MFYKILVKTILFLALACLSTVLFAQTKHYKTNNNNYIELSKYTIYSTNDTLEFGNEYISKIYSPKYSELEVFNSIFEIFRTLVIILPDTEKSIIIWTSSEVDRFEFVDFNQDQKDELVIETEFVFGNMVLEKLYILSLDSYTVDTLFYTDGYSFTESPPENVSPLSRTFVYKIKDYNTDKILDLKVKTIRKYGKERNCDCDKDHFYKVSKQFFYYKNGEFEE